MSIIYKTRYPVGAQDLFAAIALHALMQSKRTTDFATPEDLAKAAWDLSEDMMKIRNERAILEPDQ